jgi:hypothetical protein
MFFDSALPAEAIGQHFLCGEQNVPSTH